MRIVREVLRHREEALDRLLKQIRDVASMGRGLPICEQAGGSKFVQKVCSGSL